MTLALVLLGALIVLATACGFVFLANDSEAGFFGMGIFGVSALLLFGLICVNFFAPRHDRAVCEKYGEIAERPVKFEHYSFWEWDCLTKTDDGWVSTDHIVKVDD